MLTSAIRARRSGWVLLPALVAASVASAAHGQAATDSGRPHVLADSVPATGGRLPRLQVGAYIGTIRADSIVPTAPIFQFTDLLTARLPGVDVQSGGGMSGSGARVIIRGTGSTVDGSDPVVYLDGVRIASDPSRPATGGGTDFVGQSDFVGALGMSRLDDLSPNEIQRVDVLTGPAATTQYGLDAWNGVVLITTRRPAAGAPKWTAYFEDGVLSAPSTRFADTYFGWGHEPNGQPEPLSCSISAQVAGVCVLDSITHFSPLDNGSTSPLTTGNRDRFGLQAGGSAGPGRYFLSGERQSEMGMLEMPGPEVQLFTQTYGHSPNAGQLHPNSLDRTNLRATLGAQLGDNADISFFGNSIGGVHRSVGDAAFSEDVAVNTGSLTNNGGWFDRLRPSRTFATEGADHVERYIYGGSVTWRPAPILSAQLTAGADRANTHAESYTPEATPTPTQYTEATEHEVTTEYTGDANVTADVPVAHGWSSRTSLGLQYREQRQAHAYFEASTPAGVPFPDTTPGTFNGFQVHNDGIQRSAYLEETAAWGPRLSVTAALRAEGPGGLFGAGTLGYPRVAVSWSPVVRGDDVLRLHAAYGLTGDLPVSQVYNLQENVTSFLYSSGQLFGGTPPLEQVAEYEGGADATFLHGRLSAGFSVYDRTVSRMPILNSELVDGFVFTRFTPTGILRNRGAEVTMSAQIVRSQLLTWNASFNGWTNANRVITIGANRPPEFIGAWYRIQAGHPIYSIWEPTVSYHDANGDGIIEANEVTLGHPTDHGSAIPTRGASLQNSFAFLGGRFRAGALIDYKGGNKLVDEFLADQLLFGTVRGNVDPHAPLAEQAWQVAADEGGTDEGEFFAPAEDASFVRFRELSLTVNFGNGVARALRTRSVALSLLARNLWIWTPYRGADPEVNIAANGDPAGTETVLGQPRYFVARVTLGY